MQRSGVAATRQEGTSGGGGTPDAGNLDWVGAGRQGEGAAPAGLQGRRGCRCRRHAQLRPVPIHRHRCLQEYGRHSNSIDVDRKACGACRGRLAFLGRFKPDGSPAKPRAPSAYSQFTSENFSTGEQAEYTRKIMRCSCLAISPRRISRQVRHPPRMPGDRKG